MRRIRAILASFAVVAVLAACGGGDAEQEGDGQVGDAIEGDVTTPPVDTGGGEPETFVCTKADDCTGRVTPGTCELADCVDGACVAVDAPAGTTCDDGNGCTDGDVCTAGTCAGTADPECIGPCDATSDCAAFEDGDACNGTLVCNGGVCELDDETVVECSADDDCATYVCNATTGACDATPINEGGLCEDDTIVDCTVDLECAAGECVCPTCETGCELRECGADPSCAGQTCGDLGGACPAGETCDADGMCQPETTCQSQCGNRECGADPGPGCAGETCGTLDGACPAGEACNAQGLCECAPDCNGKVCGPDGCDGTCGECTVAGELCSTDGTECIACADPQCGEDQCGESPVCPGVACGFCEPGIPCVEGQCDPCFGVGDAGCCEDGILLYCQDGILTSINCGASPDVDLDSCGWNAEFGYYDCVAEPSEDPAGAPRECPELVCPTTCAEQGRACGLLPECPWLDCGGCTGTDECDPTTGQCVEPPCQGVAFEGCCQEDGTLLYCDPDFGLQLLDCNDPESPGPCGWDAEGSFYNCGGDGAEPSGQFPIECPAIDCGTCAEQGVECGPNPACPWEDCGGCPDGERCLPDGTCDMDRCLGVPEIGCCDDGALYACVQNTLVSQVCADGGEGNVCGWYEGDFFTAPGYYCGPAEALVAEDPSGEFPAACDFGACVNADFCDAAGYECGMGCPGESCGECGADEMCGFDHKCHPLACGAGNQGADAACGAGPTTVTGDTSTGTNAVQNYPTCVGWEYTGPEAWHEFTPSCDGSVTVTLSGPTDEANDLDLLVLAGECAGDAETCVGSSAELGSAETITFDAVQGTTYYIVVEGYAGGAGAYTLETFCACTCVQECGGAECGPDPVCGVSCGDCDDNQICNAGTCEELESTPVSCDTATAGNNGDGSAAIGSYGCTSWTESGPEVIYAFTATATEDVDVYFNQDPAAGGVALTGDLDLFVMGSPFDVNACLFSGDTRLTIAAEAGQTYYIVVDGYNGAVSDFVLAIDCASVCADPQCGGRECGAAPGPFCAGFECEPGCADGQICGADGLCMADPCQGVTYEGCCEDDAVVWCETADDGTRSLAAVHCGIQNPLQGCGWLAGDQNYFWCGATDPVPPEFTLECPALECATTCEAEGVECGALQACPWIWCGVCDGTNEECYDGECRQDPCAGIPGIGCCDGTVLHGCTAEGPASVDCATLDEPTTCGWYAGDFFNPPGHYCGGEGADPNGTPLECTTETCDNAQLCQDWGLECGTGCPGEECGTCPDGQSCDGGLCIVFTPKTCATPATINCGDTLAGSNGPAADALNGYACASSLAETAGDEVYALTLDADSEVAIDLTGLSADLDLFVLTGTCDAASCSNHSAGVSSEHVELTGTAGTTYYIVVDGYGGSSSAYSLAVTCGAACVPDCTGLECGPDPVCGTECGPCGGGQQCTDGVCEDVQGLTCATPGSLACGASVQGDTTTSPALMTDYDCSFFAEPGGEDVYELTGLGVGATATLSLTGLTNDLDLLLFAVAEGGQCGAAACVDYGDSSIEFAVEAGVTYYAVVETYRADEPDAYTLALSCTAVCDPVCGEGQECVDGTCVDLPTLSCDGATPITCDGGVVTGDNTSGSDVVEEYSCSNWTESGPEVVYSFTAPAAGWYSFDLVVGDVIDLDLFVLDSACDPAACLAYGSSSATFEATAGATYYIVVEGYLGDAGAFDLTPVCNVVEISDYQFTPAALTIATGETVRWINVGPSDHTSTSTGDPVVWDSGTLFEEDWFDFTFDTAGTYPYECTLHPEMTGTITVE